MSTASHPKRSGLNIWRLRFSAEAEAAYRTWLRNNVRYARTGLFLTLAIIFGLSPFFQGVVFKPEPLLVPVLNVMDAILCLQLLLTAALTWSGTRQRLTQVMQSIAVLSTLSAVLWLRYSALEGRIEYPASVLGVLLIAVAYFGGFSWSRIAPLMLGFTATAIFNEITYSSSGHPPHLPIYTLSLLTGIAIVGIYHQELLMRLIWQGWDKARSTQAALAESESRFQAFMQNIPLLAWMRDEEGRYVLTNKAYRDNFRIPNDGWVGQIDRDPFSAGNTQDSRDHSAHTPQSGPKRVEVSLRDLRNGEPKHWAVHKFLVRDHEQRLFVAGLAENITQQKKLEQALQQSESRFEAYLDCSPALSWMKDEAGRYLYVSASYREFLGVGSGHWRGRTDFDFFPTEFARRCREQEMQILTDGTPMETVGAATDVRGTVQQWKLVRYLFADSGGHRFIGGIATNINAFKPATADTPAAPAPYPNLAQL